MSNNEVIAEFIGFQKTSIGWYDNLEKLSLIYTNDNTFDELLFDKSFDWLMPVIQKIFKMWNSNIYYQVGHVLEDIKYHLLDADIEELTKYIVMFIEYYNIDEYGYFKEFK